MSELALFALRATGWTAAVLLTLTLAVTPLARLRLPTRFPRAKLLASRRSLGVACAVLALAHATTALVVYLPSDAWSAITEITWLRSGALAVALLVPLLLTSFPALVRNARIVLWKPLHRLAYVAAALVVHHLLLAPFAPRAWVLALAVVLALVLLARLRPRPR